MKTIEFTEFTLDNDPQIYRLVYDFNALCDAEAETKENLLQYVFVIGKPSAIFITAAQQRAMLYALLKPGHPQVLLKEAGELLSRDTKRVADAMVRALGIESEESDDEPKSGADAQEAQSA
jgi:hypothetical protein